MAVSRRLSRFLQSHRVVGVDTNVFLYHLQHHARYFAVTSSILGAWEVGPSRGVTSVLSLSEALIKPFRDADNAAAEEYRRLFTTFPNLGLREVTLAIADRAARIRAFHMLELPDAIHVATALAEGATGFVSNDPDFKRVPGIEVLLLDEVAPARR